MKKSRFSDEQFVKMLSSVTGGTTVREVCQSHGSSENTFYTSNRKYAGMESDDIRNLKDIQSENQTLKWSAPTWYTICYIREPAFVVAYSVGAL